MATFRAGDIRSKFLNYKPEKVLISQRLSFIDNILRWYQPESQPWNDEEEKYCEIMVSAALVRRVELRHKRSHRFKPFSCSGRWRHSCRSSEGPSAETVL